jgi:hypothetical protein
MANIDNNTNILKNLGYNDKTLFKVAAEVTAGGSVVGSNMSDSASSTTAAPASKLGDLWIKNFIRSENWKPKTTGFTIDGQTGYVEFSSGWFGAWNLLSGAIYYDGATDALSSGMSPADYPFYAGKKFAYRSTAPFRVTTAGAVYASNIIITGGTVVGISVNNVANAANGTANPTPVDLAVPASVIAAANDGTQSAAVSLTWTAIVADTFDHYVIRYKKHGYTYYTYLNSTVNAITVEGLVPNINYDFGVSAVNKYGVSSAFSTDIIYTTPSDTTAPGTVTFDSATAAVESVILKWTHNTDYDLASYNIYRHTADNSALATLVGNCRTDFFVDGGRTGDIPLFYWIKAVDTSGNASANFSASKTATPRKVISTDIADSAVTAVKTSIAAINPVDGEINANKVGTAQIVASAVVPSKITSYNFQLSAGTFTNNSPDAGKVAWANVKVVYNGTEYSITNGNCLVPDKHIYWKIATPTVFSGSETIPAMGNDDFIVAFNDSGTANMVWNSTVVNGNRITAGSVTASNMAAHTITANEIAARTITANEIVTGTLTANEIATNTITSDKVLNVGASKILINGATTFLNSWLSFKGDYDAGTVYKKGDQVLYLANYWNYINASATSGHTPVEGAYWTAGGASQLVTIDGGMITANTVTTTNLNFVPVESTNVIASINASSEDAGLKISAARITIAGSTTFLAEASALGVPRAFYAEPTTPYYAGDLWMDGSVLKKCTSQRLVGAYNAADWSLAVAYTDDTVANSKVTTFAQASVPTSITVGDIWIDTDDSNTMYRAAAIGANEIKAGEWELMEISGSGGVVTFAQDGIPTSTSIGDIWADTNDGNKMYRAAAVGADEIKAGEWVAIQDANKLSATGGAYASAGSGPRVLIFPSADIGVQIIDDEGNDVFKAMVGDGAGTIGDVSIGNYSGGQGLYYDKSAGTTTFNGTLDAVGGGFGSITSGNITLNSSGYIRGGQSAFKVGDGVYMGYDIQPELEVWALPDSSMGDYAWANGSKNPIFIRFPLHTGTSYLKQVITKLKLASAGTSSTIYCDFYVADSNFKPTGASLGQASIAGITNTAYEEKTFTFTDPVSVNDDDDYVAVLTCASTTPAIHLYYSSFSSDIGFRVGYYSGGAWTCETNDSQPWVKIYSYNSGYKFSIGNSTYNLSYNASNLRTSAELVVYSPSYADRFTSYSDHGIDIYSLGQNTMKLDQGSNGLRWFVPKTLTAGRWVLGGLRPYYAMRDATHFTYNGLEVYGYFSGGMYFVGTSTDVWRIIPKAGTTLHVGSSTQKISAFYSNNYFACPLPSVPDALTKFKAMPKAKTKDKLKKPKNAHFEFAAEEKKAPREYFDIDDFPAECTSINSEGEKDLEIVRIVGFLTQAVRDLAEEVDLLKKNKK